MIRPAPARRRALGAVLAALLLATPATDAGAQGRAAPTVRIELLPGWTTERGTRIAALRLTLTPGWHTYWRIPGEAGIAPRFDWDASQNLAGVQPIWPRPQVFDQNGYRSYGYADELLLPIELTPQNPAHPVALSGALSIGICHDICVPVEVPVNGVLRGAGAADPGIRAALDSAAGPGAQAGLGRVTCRLEPAHRGADLILRATLPPMGAGETIVPELPGSPYRFSDLRSWREGDELVATARLRPERRGDPVSIDRTQVAFTLLSDERMYWAQGCTGG